MNRGPAGRIGTIALCVAVAFSLAGAAGAAAVGPTPVPDSNGALPSGVSASDPAAVEETLQAPATVAARSLRSTRGDVRGLNWRGCPTDSAPTLQCATLKVPFDYDHPKRGKFRLAVSKLPATGVARRSLIFNPGGPGGAGAAAVAAVGAIVPASIRARFDIVSWDPRGIGATRPTLRDCATPYAVRPISGRVDWSVVRNKSAANLAKANRQCQKRNARFINYIGTNNAARDLDRLRTRVGDSKLTYWGMSYGTRIGVVYALLYPNRVRAMVQDGNIDPKGSYAGLTQGGVAADQALGFIRKVSPTSYASLLATRDGLAAAPIDLGGGKIFTRWSYLDHVLQAVGAEARWPAIDTLPSIINQARVAGAGGDQARSILRSLLAATKSNSNAGGAFSVVNCLDYKDRMSATRQRRVVKRNATVAPVFGGSLTTDYAVGCRGLKVKPDPIPRTRSKTNRARIVGLNIVIANATKDAATPMRWAKSMANAFPKAAFIKYRGGQHVIWNNTPSVCVARHIDPYVRNVKHPRSKTCDFASH
ncbi:MAG: alpha/beta fold hydrolase [Candidatus Nanopelagicales bacterium]